MYMIKGDILRSEILVLERVGGVPLLHHIKHICLVIPLCMQGH